MKTKLISGRMNKMISHGRRLLKCKQRGLGFYFGKVFPFGANQRRRRTLP
jgi:hypothetical protein